MHRSMGYNLLPWALCLLPLATHWPVIVAGETKIFVVAPNILHVDEPINVTVFTENPLNHQTVHLEIRNDDDDHQLHSQNTMALTTGEQSYTDVVLQVNSSILGPAVGDATPTYVKLKATSENFVKILRVLVDRRTGMMYLQTDKPIYAPQHTVHLYVFTLDKDRKANTKNLTVYIKNPVGVLRMQKNTTSVMGMSHVKFIVPDPATHGNWSVEVSSGYMKKTLIFDVEEYVLPHYKVKIELPQVITPQTTAVNCKVTARYSFSASVKGNGRVKIWVKDGDKETRPAPPITFTLRNGESTVSINISHIKQFMKKIHTDVKAQLRIEAEVAEKSTGRFEKARVALVDFADSPYIVSTKRVPSTFPPELELFYQIGVSFHSGRPVEGVRVIVKQTSDGPNQQLVRETNKNGFASFIMAAQENKINSVNLKVYVNNSDTDPLKDITLHKSQMAEHMIIEGFPQDNELKFSNRMETLVLVRSVGTKCTLHYVMVSGGQIVHRGQQNLTSFQTAVTVPITHKMVPQVQIVFWYTTTMGKVISTSHLYDVQQLCKQELTLTVEKVGYKKPGDDINLNINGPKNGTVALMGIDETVHYMSESNLLSKSKMFEGVGQRDTGCAYTPGGTSTHTFEHAGIAILSSLPHFHTTQRPSLNCPRQPTRQRRSIPLKKTQDNSGNDIGETRLATIRVSDLIQPRDDFPESFLIKTVKLDLSGRLDERVKLPDTISTWLLTGVSLSEHTGMCVAQPYEQVVKKVVFIRLHMPYRAVVGEQIELQATVHNTGDSNVAGTIRLKTTSGFFCNEKKTYLHKYVLIAEGASFMFSWLITPAKAGEANIEVAYSNDKVIRHLTIIPAGLRTTPSPVFVTLTPEDQRRVNYTHNSTSIQYNFQNYPHKREQTVQVTFSPPSNVIRDTHKAKLQLSAGPIADILSTFEKQMAYYMKDKVSKTQGEEVIGRLSPIVCTARYTSARLTLHPNTTAIIDEGVKAMMLFRTEEGAFRSVRNQNASIWLTAFTVRTLSAARPFSPHLKQFPDVVCDAVKWLLNKKLQTGAYMDSRGVHPVNIIRGSPDEEMALTAYVSLALKESECDQASNLIDTLDYLAGKVQTAMFPYTKAIITYALAKSHHPDAHSSLRRLLGSATHIRDHYPKKSYWKNISPHRSTPSDIETTAYGVSAMVELDESDKAKPYMEWLMSKRRANGLFRTSQTTVVGLQALTDYSLNRTIPAVKIRCTISLNKHARSRVHSTLRISDQNGIQQFIVPQKAVDKLHLLCKGRGEARLMLQSEYYIEKFTSDIKNFNIKITTKDVCPGTYNGCEGQRRVRRFNIKVCIRARLDVGESVVDIAIPTGCKPNTYGQTMTLPNGCTQITSDKSVIFHIPNVMMSAEVCINVNMKRDHGVEYIKEAPINVYDRYNPDFAQVEFYKHRSRSYSYIADEECPQRYAYKGQCPGLARCKLPRFSNAAELHEEACSCIYDYVFEARVMNTSWEEDGLTKIKMHITKIAKQGSDRPLNQIRIFATPVDCRICETLLETRLYFIMGKEDIEEDAAGRIIYHISKTTYLVRKGGNRPDENTDPDGMKKWRVHKRFLNQKGCLT